MLFAPSARWPRPPPARPRPRRRARRGSGARPPGWPRPRLARAITALELDGLRAEVLGAGRGHLRDRPALRAASRRWRRRWRRRRRAARPSSAAPSAWPSARRPPARRSPGRATRGRGTAAGRRLRRRAAARRASAGPCAAAALKRARSTSGDQVRGVGLVPAASRWATARRDVAGRRRPRAGARVQLGDVVRRDGVGELPAQDVAEDVVVAKPLATRSSSGTRKRFARSISSSIRLSALVAHRVAQRCAEAVEHAGVEQETMGVRVLGRDDLVAQVVDQVAVVGEVVGAARPGSIAERQAREVEPRGPALGLGAQLRELVLRQGERERIVQERRRLRVVEAQLLAGDLVSSASARRREMPIGGSVRVAMTRCAARWRWSSRKRTPS